ncbi:50S ribosomal protein L35 [Candidatus Uhrbacteria bacterium]|nr:50S ribosomal protein L35 [Candidatus Uhrbacteria bacterium]
MAKQKTHKALASRIKITKTGKVLKRYAGQDHFNSRDTGKISRKKRRDTTLSGAHRRAIKDLIPNTPNF